MEGAGLTRAGVFHAHRHGDGRDLRADPPGDAGRLIAPQRAHRVRIAVGGVGLDRRAELEAVHHARDDRVDVGRTHRHVDLALGEERMAERQHLVADDLGDRADGGQVRVAADQRNGDARAGLELGVTVLGGLGGAHPAGLHQHDAPLGQEVIRAGERRFIQAADHQWRPERDHAETAARFARALAAVASADEIDLRGVQEPVEIILARGFLHERPAAAGRALGAFAGSLSPGNVAGFRRRRSGRLCGGDLAVGVQHAADGEHLRDRLDAAERLFGSRPAVGHRADHLELAVGVLHEHGRAAHTGDDAGFFQPQPRELGEDHVLVRAELAHHGHDLRVKPLDPGAGHHGQAVAFHAAAKLGVVHVAVAVGDELLRPRQRLIANAARADRVIRPRTAHAIDRAAVARCAGGQSPVRGILRRLGAARTACLRPCRPRRHEHCRNKQASASKRHGNLLSITEA